MLRDRCPHDNPGWLLALCWALIACPFAWAQQSQPAPVPDGTRYAVIVVGLAGDDEHRAKFHDIVLAWTRWLREDLQIGGENILVLSGSENDREVVASTGEAALAAATTASIRARINSLNERLHENDSLWVFFLGHANVDEEHAYFHLPGPDMNEDDVAELFAKAPCHEQVFWLTHACSGWFLKALSDKDRIVITATDADREYNETEFPAALATVLEGGLENLDNNKDGRVSIAELFVKTNSAVEARFAAEQLAPTEQAQLDDNGDGVGTEAGKLVEFDDPSDESDVPVTGRVKARDGQLAASVFLPSKPAAERTEDNSQPRD